MANNTVVHLEWLSTNIGAMAEFLTGMFGWQFVPFGPDGEYLFYSNEGGVSAGLQRVDELQPGSRVVAYVGVNNLDSYLQRAVELGGTVVVDKTEIPDVGSFAHVAAPDGSLVGLVG